MKIVEFFNGNPWLNILFLFLALISIFLAFVFYFKSLRLKKPVYSSQTNRLINSNVSTLKNIEIKYAGSIVENLTVTKVAIWNSGKESIKNLDIASTDPLIILAKDDFIIYDYEVINQKDVNNIILTKNDEKTIKITFEFLDFNDGIVVNIFHSGKISDDIEIRGTLIGAKKIARGVKNEFMTKKVNSLFNPINFLVSHKNIFLRIIGWIFALPSLIVVIPVFIILTPIDIINDKILNRTPKEFYLHD